MISLASRTKPPDSSTSVARQAAIIALALSIPDHTETVPWQCSRLAELLTSAHFTYLLPSELTSP